MVRPAKAGNRWARPFGRGVGAVRGGEGVVDEDVAIGGERLDEGRIVLFLALVEAGVFEQQDVAVPSWRRRAGRGFADASVWRSHRMAEHLLDALAIGSSDRSGEGPSLGRPKWASRMTLAPLPDSSRIVGATRSMRVASVTLPSLTGTLRSTRTSTRLPADVADIVEGLEGRHGKIRPFVYRDARKRCGDHSKDRMKG
jgi:hypothetical protein